MVTGTASSAREVVEPRADGFNRLRIAGVERLCADAVAVTFEVPST
jgi:ring-1,2-phenylacetyl-CoA epoxidase subunit PaaE